MTTSVMINLKHTNEKANCSLGVLVPDLIDLFIGIDQYSKDKINK